MGGELGVEARGEPQEAVRVVGELQGELAVDRLDDLTEMCMQLAERFEMLAMLVAAQNGHEGDVDLRLVVAGDSLASALLHTLGRRPRGDGLSMGITQGFLSAL
jgi:hypothetical protein